ncbi:hypothetical protein [Vulcanococcus limneticus]|uniref:hypothetical protein n=1 Tax=Vulcanococcus limneticus TaxID=2170428 RepID=UPI00398BC418
MVAIAVLLGSLQGYAANLAGERRRVAPHWRRGLLAWLPIPLQTLEPCGSSRAVRGGKSGRGFHECHCRHLCRAAPMVIT